MKKWNLIIPVSPGTGRQNARYAGGMRLSKGYKGFLGSVKAAVIASGIPLPLPITCVGVSVTAYWPRQHRQPPLVGIPFGDIDAPLKGLLDGLEKAGVYTDDSCIVALTVHKQYDAKQPRLEVELWEIDGEDLI